MNNQLYQEWVRRELDGIYGSALLQEMNEIIGYYSAYDGNYHSESEEGKPPIRANFIKKLINDETRYMCARPPEIKYTAVREEDREDAERLTEWLSDTLKRNGWSEALLKGSRDAFIGKRVALKLSYERNHGLSLRFAPSLEFIYEPDERDPHRIKKIIFFYATTPSTVSDKRMQRIWRQRYFIEGGRCYLDEGLYDGYGNPIEISCEGVDTGLNFVPAFVIVNGGLSGDLLGESDVHEITDIQRAYDQTQSDNLDAMKYNMFGQKVFIDATPDSMEAVKIAPNAMIDLQTEPGSNSQAKAQVLESTFTYGDHMNNTLDQLKKDMHELFSVPQITPDVLTGLGTSGKALRALYWSLTCRCEERWANGWDAALTWLAEKAPILARAFDEKLPDIKYSLNIDHLYPILDDEEDERIRDLNEVNHQARSRRSYMAKWMPDDDPDAELKQILKETTMLQDSFPSLGV